MSLRPLFIALLLSAALAVPALAGDVGGSGDNSVSGKTGCDESQCEIDGVCVPKGSGQCPCDEPGIGAATAALAGGAVCADTSAGNPIDMRTGNKFHEEVVYAGGGEMPLSFVLYYNSKHYQTGLCTNCEPGSGGTASSQISGQWTHKYYSHLLVDTATIGTGSAIVELRKDDGQSIYFVEQVTTAGDFEAFEAGDYGVLSSTGVDSGTTQYYTGYEYERPDGNVEVYDADGLLTEVRSRQGAKHTLSRSTVSLGGGVDETTVTVTRSLGGSMSFKYETTSSSDVDDYCFRCPTEFTSPDSDTYTFTTNTNGLIDGVDYPNESSGTDTKEFVYEIDDSSYSGGCNAFWDCETALTGIIDEEGVRWATWDYLNERSYPTIVEAPHTAWAYLSYHGTGAEIDDHVEFSGLAEDPDDKFVVTRQWAFKEVYNLDHWDERNVPYGDDKHIPIRLRSVRDIRDYSGHALDTQAENIELVTKVFDYYTAQYPEKQGLMSSITIDDGSSSSDDRKVIEFDYDSGGDHLMTKKTEKGGPDPATTLRVTEYAWDTTLRLPTMTKVSQDGTTATEEYKIDRTYTSKGRPLTVTVTDLTTHTAPYSTNGRTRVWSYSYTYHDLAETRVDTVTINGPRSDVTDTTTLEYSTDGYLEKLTNAEGHVVEWSNHNGRGQPGTLTEPDGTTTTFTYHPRGWLRTRTKQSKVWTYDYYKNGLLKSISWPDGASQTFEYTSARKLEAIENNFGERIEFSRTFLTDGSSNKTGVVEITATVKDGLGTTVATSKVRRDALDRLYQEIGQHGQKTAYTYALKTRAVSAVQEGHASFGDLETSFEYDGLDRVTRVVYPKQNSSDPDEAVDFAHNLRGQITSVTDPRGNETEYRYDGFGDLIQLESPESGTVEYTYNPAGLLTLDTQTLDAGLSLTTSRSRTFDAIGRILTETSQPDNVQHSWEYDRTDTAHANGTGRLSIVTDNTGSTHYAYDGFGRLDTVEKTINTSSGSQTFDLDYDYDEVGNLDALEYPSGRVVTYNRTNGRLTSVDTTVGGATTSVASTITYFPFRGIDGFEYGNGLTLERTFDLSGRLEDYTVSDGSTTILDKTYGYDKFNQITSITDAAQTSINETFGYDQRHRLTDATGVYGTYDYAYDAAGNRTSREIARTGFSRTETYSLESGSNRLSSVSSVENSVNGLRTILQDARGNMTKDERDPSEILRFEYNDRNRMTRVLEQK